MKFNSQICTTVEQSKRLLELGLETETADMVHINMLDSWICVIKQGDEEDLPYDDLYPAWSLHRLIDLCTEYINIDGYPDTTYWFTMHKLDNKIIYENDYNRWLYLGDGDNLFDTLIDCIEWLIKEGYFNKEYLRNK